MGGGRRQESRVRDWKRRRSQNIPEGVERSGKRRARAGIVSVCKRRISLEGCAGSGKGGAGSERPASELAKEPGPGRDAASEPDGAVRSGLSDPESVWTLQAGGRARFLKRCVGSCGIGAGCLVWSVRSGIGTDRVQAGI